MIHSQTACVACSVVTHFGLVSALLISAHFSSLLVCCERSQLSDNSAGIKRLGGALEPFIVEIKARRPPGIQLEPLADCAPFGRVVLRGAAHLESALEQGLTDAVRGWAGLDDDATELVLSYLRPPTKTVGLGIVKRLGWSAQLSWRAIANDSDLCALLASRETPEEQAAAKAEAAAAEAKRKEQLEKSGVTADVEPDAENFLP